MPTKDEMLELALRLELGDGAKVEGGKLVTTLAVDDVLAKEMIISALRLAAHAAPCDGCDGHECDNGCQYPGAAQSAAPVGEDEIDDESYTDDPRLAHTIRIPAASPPSTQKVKEALWHALARFECLEDHFKEVGDETLWAMSSVDADRMRAALSTDVKNQEQT